MEPHPHAAAAARRGHPGAGRLRRGALTALTAVLTLAGCAPTTTPRERALTALAAARRVDATATVSVRFDHAAGVGMPVETATLPSGWARATVRATSPSRSWRRLTVPVGGPVRATTRDGRTITIGEHARWGLTDTLAITPWLVELAHTPGWGLGVVRELAPVPFRGAPATRYVATLDRARLAARANGIAERLDAPERSMLASERRSGSRWVPAGQLEVLVQHGRAVAVILRDERRPAGPLGVLFELDAAGGAAAGPR